MHFCARSPVSCRPLLLTLSNVRIKSSSSLWILEFLARKTSLWWAGTTLAWLWQNSQRVCQARVVSILESGWQTSTHAYHVHSVLCANISKQVFSYYWESAITSPVFAIFKAWCSGVQISLSHKPFVFPRKFWSRSWSRKMAKEIRQTLFWRTARPFQTIRGCLLCHEEVLGAV